MKQKSMSILCSLAMAILILDAKTALLGASEGISICLYSLIPSLLPFMVVSMLLNSCLTGHNIPFQKPISKLLRVPEDSISLLIVGILGGYPIGAQSVSQAVNAKQLHKQDGERMLAFSSNAGPAFLFGIGSCILPEVWMCWILWAIHIVSALITAILTPGKCKGCSSIKEQASLSFPQSLRNALKTVGVVCGWVILFRVLISVLERWVLWLLPKSMTILFRGTLELANGCTSLISVNPVGMRFLLFAAMLGFGGLCVAMQTFSVCSNMNTDFYLPGKITQTAISVLLSQFVQLLLPKEDQFHLHPIIIILCGVIIITYPYFFKIITKSSSNREYITV